MMSLQAWADQAWRAARDAGWDPAECDFQIVPREIVWAAMAAPLPGGPPHWTQGRDYWVWRQHFEQGGGHLYEVVYPGTPCLAYLDGANAPATQEVVILHVLGHCDLFAHHRAYTDHQRGWGALWQAGGVRVRAYQDQYGVAAVEQCWSDALSLADQVDAAPAPPPAQPVPPAPWADLRARAPRPVRDRVPGAPDPTADVLGFIGARAPWLAPWQRDICGLVRGLALYQAPVRRTKWIQEAFATWTAHRLAERVPWSGPARIQAARDNAGVQWRHPAQLNWYDVGYRLLDWVAATEGEAAVRAAARAVTDSEAVDRWVTEASVAALELYTYTWQARGDEAVAVRQPRDWRTIRALWQNQMMERPPRVAVLAVEGSTLVLGWEDPGAPDIDWARATLAAVQRLWGGPVRLERPSGPPIYPMEGASA